MILPTLTLSDVFGAGHVYNPSASFRSPGWLPTPRSVLDFLTGGQLSVVGQMTAVCHRRVSTERALDVLGDAGLAVPADLARYDSQESYRSLLVDLMRARRPIVLQHVHDEEELSPDACWVPPGLLRFLNNKANLGRLVPEDHVPEREVVSVDALVTGRTPHLPLVLKVATDLTTGGGCGVRICRSTADLVAAHQLFSSCSSVVVERFIEMTSNLCVQFVALADGEVRYLGTAAQVSDREGGYHGNWLDTVAEPPALAIDLGREIMGRGMGAGYRGFAGFDMGVDTAGQIWVFDLNLRLNGSTTGLLLLRAGFDQLGAPVMRTRSWTAGVGFADLARAVRAATARGELLPFCLYDPGDGPTPGRLGGAVLGRSRQEVCQRESDLAARLEAAP